MVRPSSPWRVECRPAPGTFHWRAVRYQRPIKETIFVDLAVRRSVRRLIWKRKVSIYPTPCLLTARLPKTAASSPPKAQYPPTRGHHYLGHDSERPGRRSE